jgi:hypothetical protein
MYSKHTIMHNNLSLNYTNVCSFCGKIYRSNRSTSKYCCKKHNSLFNAYGSQIKPLVDENGVAHSFDRVLTKIYLENDYLNDNGWSAAYTHRCIREDFEYEGPLPEGQEILLVESYIIWVEVKGARNGENIYACKPYSDLTVKEKRKSVIVQGKL